MPNQTHDNFGRPYAKLSELKVGDMIELDDGFDCALAGRLTVCTNEKGELYFRCAEGEHNLIGQADDGEHCVGIYGPIT